MWNLITGKSSDKVEASPSESRRRRDYDQRSAQQPSESIVSSKSARKPSRGDDRDGDRGFNPSSTSYSSTSRSSYPGTAPASIASSYATASNGQIDDAVLPPGLVRNASLADQIPKSRPSRNDRDHGRARERKSERRRSSSRDRKRDKDSKRMDRKSERDMMNRGDGMDRGLTRSESGYAEELSTPRAGEISAQASGNFNAQVGSTGFTQFPGQYDGAMPGFTRGPPPLHESMSAHIQDQFPGQFPLQSAAPYRPPLAASEGGSGLAADYYGDAGESVAQQPGFRPQPLGAVMGAEPHFQPASYIARPPPQPSSASGVGAAASFYSGVDFPSTLSSQPPITTKPLRQGKPNKATSSNSFSGSAPLVGSAMLGYTTGTTGEAFYTQGPGSSGSTYHQQGSVRPPSSAEQTAGHSFTSAPTDNAYHASSAPVLPTLGTAAAGAAAGYVLGSYSSAQQQPSVISDNSGYLNSATQRPHQFGDTGMGIPANSRPSKPAKYSSQSSTIPLYAAGQSNGMAQKHRHRAGPLGTFVEFWTDPDGVAQYEEYTEYIGICRNCFAPGSSPRDAPRKHHYRRRRSDDRYGSSSRVDKESRWGSSDGENRRRNRKSWLGGGIAGYGLAEVGKTLFNQKGGADDNYNVRFSRGNASSTSLRRRSGSYSPSRESRISYGVTGGSSASISRRRSRSRERIETGITSDGRFYNKDPHGSLLGGPVMKTYNPPRRSRSRSRSRSGDHHNGFAAAALGAAALGAATGSSVVASKSRRRSGSSEKAFVRSKHRSNERSSGRREASMLGSFFSSPSEKRHGSHRKKKKGFFSFGNSSSSSAEAGLAFGAGVDVSRNRKQAPTRSRNDRKADAAILGLSAAAAAIALRESQKGSKSSRKADLVAVKETKSKTSMSPERRHRERRTPGSPTMEEDLWESASGEDDSSSVESALAYGDPARRSQESLTSNSSGMGKWGWRWGSKKRSKRAVQADLNASSFHINAHTAATTLAAATAGVAGTSNTWQNNSRMSSPYNLPPLQRVHPVPTSDPSRFDVARHDSTASVNQPLMTSRPAPVPLQQPQPIVPVSHTVYTTQPPYTHSNSAPSGPPALSRNPYQPLPLIEGGSRDRSSGPMRPHVAGSFPGGDNVADSASRDAPAELGRRQRETSPSTRSAEPEVVPLPRRRRASTRDESSVVHFDLPEEPKGGDLSDWRPRETGLDQRREETKVRDADGQRKSDPERRLSNGVSAMRTESPSGPEEEMHRKGETQWNNRDDKPKKRKPGSRVVPVATRTVSAVTSDSSSELAHIGAVHQEQRREDGRRYCTKSGEGPASDEPQYSSDKGTGMSDTVEQYGHINQQVLSKSVKNPSHENYAAYFAPLELLSQSNDDRRSTNVNSDNDVTSYQIPQIINVEPKGSSPSFQSARAYPDEVDLNHMSLTWQVPRLHLIEPTPPHSTAGSTKGEASPVIKPEDASIEEREEISGSPPTPKVTWGKDETHTYRVVTPLENPEEFIGTSRKLPHDEKDTQSSGEASPVDVTPIIVERVPRHMSGDFGDDLEFAATVAAGLEDTGFDPAIVIDDDSFRRRGSPPGSEGTAFYRRPFAETITDLGLDSPGTEGAPPQRGFVEGELPSTPKYEQGPSPNRDSSASQPSKKDRTSKQKVAQRESEVDGPVAFSSKSELHDRGEVFDDPVECATEPQPMVSVPVNVFDNLDEGARVEASESKEFKRDIGKLESTSSDSPALTDLTRSEYFDAPEAAGEVSTPSSSSRKFDDFQDPKRTDKRKKKSKKSEQDGLISRFAIESPGPPTLVRNGESSSHRKSDRKSSWRDSDRYDPIDRDSRSVKSGPVSEEYREEEKLRSRKSRDNSDLYDSLSEDTRPTPEFAPIGDEFDEPRKAKKSKRSSLGYDDSSTAVSSSTTLESQREPKSKSKKNKKSGILSLFGASKSSDKLFETTPAQDAKEEVTSETFEEPRKKNKKSKERKSTRDGDEISNQASEKFIEYVPEPNLGGEDDLAGTPNDFEDMNGKHKKSEDRKTNPARDGDEGYGAANQSTSNLSRVEGDNDDGKSRRKEHKRRSQESDLMEKSGRVTQDLQAKDRDLPSTRKASIMDVPDVVHANASLGEDEPSSFLGERQNEPPPPDMLIPGDPRSLHSEQSVETSLQSVAQPGAEASQIVGIDGAPSTAPLSVLPLEDLPPLPASRPASPVPEQEDHRRRTSVTQVSESPQSPLINSSPTAIPLHFRRPPASPGPTRSSPFTSPSTPSQITSVFVPPQRRSRPNSSEVKWSGEIRPLWLVEMHGPRQEPAPVESYPSLPSSHTPSPSSSVHDPEEVDSSGCRDDDISESHNESDREDDGLRIDVSRSFEREDILGSRQATPTAASFHLDTKDNVLAQAMQDNGQTGINASHEGSPEEATRRVFPSPPKRWSHSVGDNLLERSILLPVDLEGLDDLPPLPASRSSSPLLEDHVQETSAVPREAKETELLPYLPTSSSSGPTHESHERETLSMLDKAEQLEELLPLPPSRSSPLLHESKGRETSSTLEQAESAEGPPPLQVSRSSSPLYEGLERGTYLVSEGPVLPEELQPLPASRSSTPLHESRRREISSVSQEAGQRRELSPLPARRSSSPLHESLQQTMSPLSKEAEQPKEVPHLPASRSLSLSREHETLGTSSRRMGAAVGAIIGLAGATVGLASVSHDKTTPRDTFPETEANPLSVVEKTTGSRSNKLQISHTAEGPDEVEMLSTKTSKKKDSKSRKASSSRYRDDLRIHDEIAAQPINDQNIGQPVTEVNQDIQEEDGQDGAEACFIPSTSKKSKKDKKGQKKGRGAESSNKAADPLASLNVEAYSVEGSRAVSPSGASSVNDSPAPPEADIMTSSRTTEVVQDDWQGLAAGSKKSKGKKGKKKLARSWQEETLAPSATGSDSVLEGPLQTLESQGAARDYGEENPENSTLSDAGVGSTRESIDELVPEVVSDVKESEPLIAINQGENPKDHLALEDKPALERSSNLQPRLEIARQELQSPADMLDSVQDFSGTTNVVSTPRGYAEEEFLTPMVQGFSETTNVVSTPRGYLDDEFFTPMGIPQSTQEAEAETEFPFPVGKGKASKKAKKKRKTLPLVGYVEPLEPPLEAEESSTPKGMSEGAEAEETAGPVGAINTTTNIILKPAVVLAGGSARSSDGGHLSKAVSPTIRGYSAFSPSPETTPLPIGDDLDLVEAPPADSTHQLLSPKYLPLPVNKDLDLIEELQASPADRSLTPEVVPLPRDSDLELTEALHASPARRVLTTEQAPLLTDDHLGLTEASRASSASRFLRPEAVPLPTDEDFELIEAPAAAERLLTPEGVPLPRDKDLDLTEVPQANPVERFLAPEAVPLPADEDLELIEVPLATERLLTPEVVPLPRGKDLDLHEAPSASFTGQPMLSDTSAPLIDEDVSSNAPPAASVKSSTSRATLLPAGKDLNLIKASPASLADQYLTPETVSLPLNKDPEPVKMPSATFVGQTLIPDAVPLPIHEGLSLTAPRAASVDKWLTPEAIPLPMAKDLDLMQASPASLADQSLTPEAVLLPIDKGLDLIEAPSAISTDKFLTPIATPLPIDEDSDLMRARPESSAERLLTPNTALLPTDEEVGLVKAPSESSSERLLGPEAVPLPRDEGLDLLEALPVSPVLRPVNTTLRESGSTSGHGPRLTTEKEPALTPLPPTSADGPDQLVSGRAPGNTVLYKDDFIDQSAGTPPTPDLANVKQDPSSAVARVTRDIPGDHDSPSANVAGGIEQSPTQEVPGDCFAVVPQKKSKKGKKGNQIFPVTPGVEHASIDLSSPIVATEPDLGSVDRAVSSEIPKEQMDEGDWDIPSKKKKSKKEKKEKSAVQETGYASKGTVATADFLDPQSVPIKDTQSGDSVKDLSNSSELEPYPERTEASSVWEPFQKKSKKGKKAKILKQQSLSRDFASVMGETEEPPAMSERSLAATDTGKAVQEMLLDRESTPSGEGLLQNSDAFDPLLSDPKPERMFLGHPSNFDDHLTMNSTNNERSIEGEDTEIPSPLASVPDSLLASGEKPASASASREVERMVAGRGSPRPSDDLSREDAPSQTIQGLMKPQHEDNEIWGIPAKKKGKKGKKGRPLPGPESITDESSIPPTPTLGPDAAPLNEDAMADSAETFTRNDSKMEKKAKKKALYPASSSFQDERDAEIGVMPEIDNGPGKTNTEEQSYFDQAIRPSEVQELPLSPQAQDEDLLEYAAGISLPSDNVNDKPTDIVAVQKAQESEVAWSRAVDIAEGAMAPVDSSHGPHPSESTPDAQLIADRSRELSFPGTADATAIKKAPMIEITRDPAVEDDFAAFPTKKMGKKAERQQKRQLENEQADSAEDVPLPASIQPEAPADQEALGSSFLVDSKASEGLFSPEMGAASRNALRELELEDGVSYFGLTSAKTEYTPYALASEEDQSAVHDVHTINDKVGHSFSTAPHEGTLATIVEQPDTVEAVALGHEPLPQLADHGLPNLENSFQPFDSTSKKTEKNTGVTKSWPSSPTIEQSESFRSPIDDAPIRESNPVSATIDFSTVHPLKNSATVEDAASHSTREPVAGETPSLPSNEDLSTFASSRKSKKGKKSKKKQEPVVWEDESAPPAAVNPGEPTVKSLEAPPTPPNFETPEPGVSRTDTGHPSAEHRKSEPSIETSLTTPRIYTALEDQPTMAEADDDWGYQMKKTKKKGKKMKQPTDLAQRIEDQPQLDRTGEPDALESQDSQFRSEQCVSAKTDIPREPEEAQHTDTHMLLHRADPTLMAKEREYNSVPVIDPFGETHSTSQDSLPGGIPQESIPRADINEESTHRQPEHELEVANADLPQRMIPTIEEKPDDLWDFPTTKKSKKSKKSKKQSLRLTLDDNPQDMQPEPSVDQHHQYTSTIFKDLPLSSRKTEETTSASPPQIIRHHEDGQFANAAALATVGAGVAEALWHSKSKDRGESSKSHSENRQWIAHENDRMHTPSLQNKAALPSERSLQLDDTIQQRVSTQSQLYHDSRSSLPHLLAEDEHVQNIARPPVPSFLCEDDAKRDSAVQISDSPVISEKLPIYDFVRDSGYQGTESSPPIGTDPELVDTSEAEQHPEIVERTSTQARREEVEASEQTRSYQDTGFNNADNPLNISVEVDPAYEVAISTHQPREGRGRIRSKPQDGSYNKAVPPQTDLRRAKDIEFPLQDSDGSPQLSPVDSTSKDRSSTLFKSSPSTREERTNQPVEQETLDVSRGNTDRMDVSPAYNNHRERFSELEMSPRMATHDGVSILAARASSLAALSGLTDAHQGSPRSLFGGPVGINSDVPSTISPPRTPFSLESTGRRQLNTITEHSPEESPHHKNARAISDIGSPERGAKSARRSRTPGEISQRRVRSPTTRGASDKSLISTDDVLARLSWPAVDEDKHSVDLERSRSRNTDRRPSSRPSNVSALLSDAVRQREIEQRSLSGASIRSGESINAIIRTPEQFRSASGLSNRSGTPPLRRADTRSISGDLRAASKRGEAKKLAKSAESEAEPAPAPAFALPLATPSSSTYDPVKDKGKSRVRDMADVYEGWGDVYHDGSPLSPTRPPSMRRRQSMQIMDLESRVDQLVSENRLLQDARSRAERGLEDAHNDHVQESSAFKEAIGTRNTYLLQKDSELDELRQILQSLQNEVTRLTEVNHSLGSSREVDAEYAQKYSVLQAEHSDTHEQWQQSRRELEDLRSQHSQLSTGMEGIVRHEVSIALEEKNVELARLREELEEAKEQVRTLQRQILASKPSDNFLIDRDEDYFDTQCQQLCQRVQQWVLRFSKFSDMKACRLMGDIDDEKVLDRLDNAILDGSDVDDFLADRVKRRDVFMSMVMTMIWEYVFTRYLFGMDREQRQKLKALEKTLAEVGLMTAVHKWRATTLALLSKREAFVAQRSQDSEAVVQEIYDTLSMFLPPPSHLENQIQESLRNVMKAAIDLSIEMRTQRAEYVMLPPLQPEYNTNGDLARKVFFNASLMNERSGDTSSNEELEAQKAVVRMVLFPLVVKKDDASGVGEQIVVCPAQVLVAKPGKDKKVVRVLSGDRMDVDRNRSAQSFAPSSMDMGMGNMI